MNSGRIGMNLGRTYPHSYTQKEPANIFEKNPLRFSLLTYFSFLIKIPSFLDPVDHNMDSAFHWINHYPVDKHQGNQLYY